MQRKYVGYIIAGCISLIFILMLSLNVMAAYDTQAGKDTPFATDKSDRTMLKEMLVNQGKTHTLLKEIKVLLKEAK